MRMPQLRFSIIGLFNLLGAALIVYLAVVLSQTVSHNYEMSRQIDALQQQITRLQDQRDELAYNIEYYKTDSYKERVARSKLGLQAPGEEVVVLPKTAAVAVATKTRPAPPPKSNFAQWLDFLAGT
jgi:cell division protein FtsL